jgi:aspartokinase/homoserine dehydrogenase 1
MIVLKFGGSSVATSERISAVLDILESYVRSGKDITVVFSAFGGVTDSLLLMASLAEHGDPAYIELYEQFRSRHEEVLWTLLGAEARMELKPLLDENHEVLKNLLYGVFLLREVSGRSRDYILSFGERNSAFLIAAALRERGVPASYLDARKIIRTNKQFGAARVYLDESYEVIQTHYAACSDIQIVTGFIASARGGLTTTLGRGGSDYTASLLGAALQAEHIEIWTDVDGVLTADPRKVRRAFSIPSLTYAEAMEMSHFGAKVIYPPTILPAMGRGIPLYIRNTFRPDYPGTYISGISNPNDKPVKGISSISSVALLTLSGSGLFGVPGIAARLFQVLADAGINVILITQGSSEHSISFAVSPDEAERARRKVTESFSRDIEMGQVNPVRLENDLAVVAIIGENMRYRPGIAGRMFEQLGKNGINAVAIAQGSSELNISVVIHQSDEAKALNALHEAFFLSDTRVLNLFVVGTGLIGRTLMAQIRGQSDFLRTQRGLELRLVAVANSRKMLFNEEGISLLEWEQELMEEDLQMNINSFVNCMDQLNLSNSIFIDNTASEEVAACYETILDRSISISTPNKVAASSSYTRYRQLKDLAAQRGVQFCYETNVGAGLPLLSTMADLISSGDEIHQVQGVLSGSLSYIFNRYDGTVPFSELVADARERGFTEPDPRMDLSGADVRRKLLILARESGWELEEEAIQMDELLPESLRVPMSVEAFMEALKKEDDYFRSLYDQAKAAGLKLRFVARVNREEARVGLMEVDSGHPFWGLDGADNMVVFTTQRYSERPLVVRGPGAGAEVTAAGVFAEIIRIGEYMK